MITTSNPPSPRTPPLTATAEPENITRNTTAMVAGELFDSIMRTPPRPCLLSLTDRQCHPIDADTGTTGLKRARTSQQNLFLPIDQNTKDAHLLNFFDNILRQLPPECSFLKSAEEIRNWMLDNQERLDSVRTLDCSKGASGTIRELPPEINLFRNLTYLDLSNTSIEELPEGLNFPFLKSLYIGDTQLQRFPEDISLPSLEGIHLCNTPLSTFPENFPVTLKWLDLTHTNFTGFDESFDFSRMQNLYLTRPLTEGELPPKHVNISYEESPAPSPAIPRTDSWIRIPTP